MLDKATKPARMNKAIQERSFNKIKLLDVLTKGIDLIVNYKAENNNKIKYFPISIESVKKAMEKNAGEHLIDVLNYYLSTDEDLTITKVMKHQREKYKWEDFEITTTQRRTYGENFRVIFARIHNKKTDVTLEDCLRPDQIRSIEKLNNLILWETKGEEIKF